MYLNKSVLSLHRSVLESRQQRILRKLAPRCLALGIALLTLGIIANAADAEDWGCYDPQPGHPSPEEKEAFVAELVPIAQAAEGRFGVPAPAIIAMASVESGFGFTRIALNANNLFGWKYNSAASAGNRQAYVLECQPQEDKNNRYIMFCSRDEAVSFVAMKLATLDRYGPVTNRYRAQRSQGDRVLEAVNSWIDGVADAGYNWKPDKYKRTLKAILTNYLNPGIESRDFNLYQYAANSPPTSDQPSSEGSSSDLLKLVKSKFGLYMAKECKPVQRAGWELFPVQDCRYDVRDSKTGKVKSARVLLLNPTPEKAADWIRSACRASRSTAECEKNVVAQIKSQSGFQFPVAGIVYEDLQPNNGDGEHEAYCFRDGVTVKVAGFKHLQTQPLSEEDMATCINGEVTEVMKYARIHGGTREDYLATGGKEEVGTSANRKRKWMDVVRESYQAAWNSESYSLLDAWVKVNLR